MSCHCKRELLDVIKDIVFEMRRAQESKDPKSVVGTLGWVFALDRASKALEGGGGTSE